MKRTITFLALLLMAGAAVSQGTFTCGGQITDADGNSYETVQIGQLCWTKENMKTRTYSDGSPVAKAMIYSSAVYPDTNANLATFGRLYSWFSAVNVPEGSNSKPARNADGFVQGVCPDGWHIPTVGDMNSLMAVPAEQLRSVEMWLQPNNNTNSTGFSSLPAGCFTSTIGRYEALLGHTYYWCDSSSTHEFAIACDVNYFCNVAREEQRHTGDGVSVRCVKDYSPAANTFTCGTSKVADHEGNEYNTVKIGDQCWTKENMRCKTSPNNRNYLQEGSASSNTQAYYYDNTASTIPLEERGLFYNWAATIDTIFENVNNSKITFTGNRRGICPEGWHVPSDAEWNTLISYMGNSSYICGGNSEYINKALSSPNYWNNTSAGECNPGDQSSKANNASGFSAVPSGQWQDYVKYQGDAVYFWSTSIHSNYSEKAWRRDWGHDNQKVFRNAHEKYRGYSVRCLKD